MPHFRFKPSNLLALLTLLILGISQPILAQNLLDDGFQRRNGQMSIVRHGERRPMTRDVHLPTGVVVTKDGFLIGTDGQRTELREGQGCDLRGRAVAVSEAQGRLTLAPVGLARPQTSSGPVVQQTSVSLLDELLGRPAGGRGWYKKGKKWKKGHGHGKHKGRDDND